MTKRLYILLMLVLTTLMSWAQVAQDPLIYYVRSDGAYSNNGQSWEQAKANVQDAINALHDYMVKSGITTGGYVFVAGAEWNNKTINVDSHSATYRPTESTETTAGTTQNMSFKMFAGITVSGGWQGDEVVGQTIPNRTPAESFTLENMKSGEARPQQRSANNLVTFTYHTVLSGNLLAEKPATFTWNTSKQYYNTAFPSNVYHVVWFATNGFESDGRAKALPQQSVLDCVTIEGGRAYNKDLAASHPHNAYGAGAYMVEGAVIKNSEIRNCEASRDGAGLYFDGGGEADHNYIHGCQTLGLGIQYGRGGAVCLDNGGLLQHSFLVNNVAREGAGLAIYTKGLCKATLIANNTATTEAGGAYLNAGGILNGVSVYRNRCNGTGAVINGITTGQSAGIFAVGAAKIYNTVMWGGQIGDNDNPDDDLQFSAYKQSSATPALYYVAMNNSDRVNWSNATTNNLTSLATSGTGSDVALKYINLVATPNAAGVLVDGDTEASKNNSNYLGLFDFRPNFISAIVNAGVLLEDIPTANKVGTEGAETDLDALDVAYSPLCDLGAYVAKDQQIAHAIGIAMVDGTGETATTMTLFVDPNRSTSLASTGAVGASWDRPLQNIRDALTYIAIHRDDNDKALTHYQILCKEGTLHTAGTNTAERLVSTSIYLIDNVHVFGGYPSALTGSELSNSNYSRDPIEYPTIITGSIFEGDYAYNATHLVTFANISNAVLDGFQLRYGNASAQTGTNSIDWGAGILMTNMFEITQYGLGIASERKTMANNVVRNSIISGCTARSGSALYTHCVNGTSGFTLENCIIHNNGVIYGTEDVVPTSDARNNRSTIHVGANVTLNISHCDILRNVGYGINAAAGSKLNIDNSIIYANLNKAIENTNNWDTKEGVELCAPIIGTGTINGSYNLFDTPNGAWTGKDEIGSSILTYNLTDNPNYTYPQFKNPTKNSGVSPEGDVTLYGNATDFMPMSMNPAVNAADPANVVTTDITLDTYRAYGNLPDIGAVENTDQPQSSFGYYVRDYGSDLNTTDANGTLRDGMSWKNAINGNAVYLTQTSGDGAIIGYKMRNRSTGKYISKTIVQNSGNHPTLQMTATVGDAEIFTFSSNVLTGTSTSGKIYAQTVGLYFNFGTVNGFKHMWLASGGATHYAWKQVADGGTDYYCITAGGSYFLTDDGNNVAYSVSTATKEQEVNQWELVAVRNESQTNIYGLQYAINNASTNYATDNQKREIWVGAGTYNHGITMANGVDVLGGFLGVGNPTKKTSERDLSNSKMEYQTVVDAGQVTAMNADANGYLTATFKSGAAEERALTTSDFNVETMIEGVTLKGGYTTNATGGAGAYLCQNTLMKNCLVTGNYADGSTNGCGAGVYMTTNATVKNSIIKQNLLENTAHTKGGAGLYISNTGNKLINSLIVENVASTHNAANILGAAVVCLKSGSFYNCTIAYNIGYQINHNGAATGGFWDQEKNSLFINCILWGNYATGNTYENFFQVGMPGFSYGQGLDQSKFKNCYHSTFSENTACTLSTDPNYSELVWLSNKGAGSQSGTQSGTALTTLLTNVTNFAAATKTTSPFNPDYSLKSPIASISTNCINKAGDGSVLTALNIYEDITGANRVQDCALDKGAYEYNGAAEITPTITTADSKSTAAFYVSESGNGTASAQNAANAACWQKIQKVLDAAGRYKYDHPTHTVKVYLAGKAEGVKYSPRRTADPSDVENDRSWSLMVPNGVEVYGGFENGFVEENRSITTYKTILDGVYKTQNVSEGTRAYHVVTFTDRVYDAEGMPYTKNDNTDGLSSYSSSVATRVDESALMSLSAKFNTAGVSTQAILDGLFITNGQADGTESSSSNSKNYSCYGGAAIVPSFARIQNCIVTDNKATTGGGAFLLQPGSLVTGTLMKGNTAKYGGAVYFEEWTPDSWIDEATNTTGNFAALTIYKLAQLYTSTIVKNSASIKGGGIYFDNNARVNSSVIWGNTCGDQANVAGQTSAYGFAASTATTYEAFPFAYSAVENNRLPGANNISVVQANDMGTRFGSSEDGKTVAKDETPISEYYPLTDYSVLAKRGMSRTSYASMTYMGIPSTDLAGTPRVSEGYDYIDIGARAISQTKPQFTLDKVLLRLYVAQSEDVNMEAKDAMTASNDDIYSQKGSSFAYPMQSLDEALEYIRDVRMNSTVKSKTKDLPFEIVMARGTYYPSRDIYNVQGQSFGNTFLVPEGVTIVGGFMTNQIDGENATKTFYGQVANASGAIEGTASIEDYTIKQADGINAGSALITNMKLMRAHADNNANDIIEPWEFTHQTILSGKVINSEAEDHVYHVVTAVGDKNLVGELPTGTVFEDYDDTNGDQSYVRGATIELNGLQITDGQAYKYHSIASKGFMTMDYYHGGGVMIDGNWGTDANDDPIYYHQNKSNAVGYRNIPLVIDRCNFIGNEAGWGGAISSNGEISIYNSAFSGNAAYAGRDETASASNSYAGNGGAIYSTGILTAINTLFQNNEANERSVGSEPQTFASVRNQSEKYIYPGCGGAIYCGAFGQVQLTNCNFVRNKANMFPAVFSRNPNIFTYSGYNGSLAPKAGNYNKITNCVFWGNLGTNLVHPFSANLIMSFCPEGTDKSQVPESADDAYRLLPDYRATTPMARQAALDAYAPALWFCAYEQGTGQTPVNTIDVRRATTSLIDEQFASITLESFALRATDASDPGLGMTREAFLAAGGGKCQDANVIITSDNAAIDGPNFSNPSHQAGANGYMQDADWMPSRMNKLTDAGWGYIEQTTEGLSDEQDMADGVKFVTETVDGSTIVKSQGAFPEIWKFNKDKFSFGYDTYMKLLKDATVSGGKDILRISKVPTPTVADLYAYIDLGVYEYQHQKLGGAGGEVDYLWVSPKEKLENGAADGSDWNHPTSDLQRAIETLISNRNGHPKTIYMIEGEYKPIYTFTLQDEAKTKNFAFTINTKDLNKQAIAPSRLGESSKVNECATSLTILGGFSSELESVVTFSTSATDASSMADRTYSLTTTNRNIEKYPTIITTENADSRILFHIEDARQWYGIGTEGDAGNASTLKGADNQSTVIPISIDGVTFQNSYSPHNDGSYPAALHYAAQPYEAPLTCVAPSANKLTVSNCIFSCNGVSTANIPAVRIESDAHYPGQSLIYNSLFHSNNGKSLMADRTKVVNCTFAKNKDGVDLTETGAGSGTSELHASILWSNGGTEYHTIAQGAKMTYNAIEGLASPSDNNVALVADNSDLNSGPNFVDPNNATPSRRDFHIMPSTKILNTVPETTYTTNVHAVTDWATELDLSASTRKHGDTEKPIDRGAYEYQKNLQSYVYFDPNRATSGDGKSWSSAFAKGDFQKAIDLVAVHTASGETSVGYVFAKGGRTGLQTEEAITVRNGVNLLGSIEPGYGDEAVVKNAGADVDATTLATNLTTYANKIRQTRPGLVGPSTERTIINSLSSGGTFTKKTIIDGLEIVGRATVNGGNDQKVLTLCNSIAQRDITVTAGLLYNSLVLGRVSCGLYGYVANITSTDVISAQEGHAINNISGYSGCKYYHDQSSLLKYQLAEDNAKINTSDLLTDNFNSFASINYTTDRDILGNPRTIGERVDRGAFETWKIEGTTPVVASYSESQDVWRYFPHEGSNMYLMKGSTLAMKSDFYTQKIGIIPNYLLLEEGASFYGQGTNVNVSYLSVDRTVPEDGCVMSLPFTHSYGTIDDDNTANAYTYNGAKRSAYDYEFVNSNSACWEQVTKGNTTPANVGVFYHLPSATGSKSIRFTTKGSTSHDYIYSESGASKTVTLTQYDDATSTAGAADFTSQQDMGWNCIGIPYLVSDYKPYLGTNGSPYESGAYMLNVPHTLWLYYDGQTYSNGTTKADGDGGFYSVPSWQTTDGETNLWHMPSDDTPRLWVGEGFFTQTSTVKASEALKFYYPVYVAPASASPRQNLRYYVTDIEAPLTDNTTSPATQGTYDLSGRPVRPENMVRGIYIVNGRKMVVR